MHAPGDDSVAQYVAGTMPAVELDEFEEHLLGCEECRAAVRAGAAIRVALSSPLTATMARAPATNGRRLRLYWLAAAAAAAMIVVFAISGDSSLERLGAITPAPFVAGLVRPSSDAVTALVDSGMVAYAASDFGAAAERLGRAAPNDSSASVAFFLGVSLLMRGDTQDALKALGRVTPGSAYTAEAAYYLAKALVRLERPDSAIAVLERAASAGPAAGTLKAFADSIRNR